MKKFLVIAAVIAAPLSVSAASAQVGNPISRRVQIADLDLQTEAGQRVLRGRIGQAVTFVCGNYPVGAQPEEVDRLNACRKAATGDAHHQLAARKGYAVYAAAETR
jgi:UrcA family protein